MGWNFYNASSELQINDGGVQASAAVFTGKVDLGSNLLVGNAGSTGIAISSAGEGTMAAQPAVAAVNSSCDCNQTGSGDLATIEFDTEVFDVNADFNNGTDTFTAPITGKYLVSMNVEASGWTTAISPHGQSQINIVSSNRTWSKQFGKPTPAVGTSHSESMTAVIDMDAADTLTVTYAINGESSAVVDITGAANPRTFLTVLLVA